MTLWTGIRDTPCSTIGRNTSCHNRGLSWFYSVLPRKWLASARIRTHPFPSKSLTFMRAALFCVITQKVVVNSLPTFFYPWRLKMGPIGCPETSVWNYHYSLRNNPEERSSHLLRGGCLKSPFHSSLPSCSISTTTSVVKYPTKTHCIVAALQNYVLNVSVKLFWCVSYILPKMLCLQLKKQRCTQQPQRFNPYPANVENMVSS